MLGPNLTLHQLSIHCHALAIRQGHYTRRSPRFPMVTWIGFGTTLNTRCGAASGQSTRRYSDRPEELLTRSNAQNLPIMEHLKGFPFRQSLIVVSDLQKTSVISHFERMYVGHSPAF
jgi:hypothetical protein